MGMWRGALLVLTTAVVVVWLPNLFKPTRPVVIGGFAEPGWEKIERVFRERVTNGLELGGSFAVYHRGKLVVHLYGGYADEEAHLPWRKNTMSAFFSTTKGVGAILMAILVDRGYLDYDELVSKYWPEFAQNGKEKVTVRQLLSHQVGLVTLDESVSILKLIEDPAKVAAIAAATKPLWTPGEGSGYHAMTIGVYMDELIRRTDPQHRNISQFLYEEIGKPFGVDFHMGCPRSEHYRVARMKPLSPGQLLWNVLFLPEIWPMYKGFFTGGPDHPFKKAMFAFKELTNNEFSLDNPLIREVPLASSNGFGTAEGAAKIMGIVANAGELGGKILMKPETTRKLFEPVSTGIDKVLGLNMTYGLATNIQTSPEGNIIAGHPGSGGQMAYMDPVRRLGWGYVTNYHSVEMFTETYKALTKAMYEAIKTVE